MKTVRILSLMVAACFAAACSKAPTSLTVTPSTVEIIEGESVNLTAAVQPEGASFSGMTWTSSDENVAMVSSSGKLVGISAGSATVTATADGVSGSASVTVKARPIPVTDVFLSQYILELTVGESAVLTAKVMPEGATDKSVTWSSSNPSVASVEDGRVVAVKVGEAVITVRTNDGGHDIDCTVTVVGKEIPATGLTLDNEEMTVTEGDTFTLNATVIPEDSTFQEITWDSSDYDVVSVDSKGNLTALQPGKARITATLASDASIKAYCYVTVNPDGSLKGISLDVNAVSLSVGSTRTLTVIYNPAYATNKNVTWSSSDNSVAMVEAGVVTAVSSGSATVTVTSQEGGYTASCEVAVEKTVSLDVYLTYESDLYKNGENTDLYAKAFYAEDRNTYRLVTGQGWFRFITDEADETIYTEHKSWWNNYGMVVNNGIVYVMGYFSNEDESLIVELSPDGNEKEYVIKPGGKNPYTLYQMSKGPSGKVHFMAATTDEYNVKSFYFCTLQNGKIECQAIESDQDDWVKPLFVETSSGDLYGLNTIGGKFVFCKNGSLVADLTNKYQDGGAMTVKGSDAYFASVSLLDGSGCVTVFKNGYKLYDLSFDSYKYFDIEDIAVDDAGNVYTAICGYDYLGGSINNHKVVVMQNDHLFLRLPDEVHYANCLTVVN